MLLFTGMRPNEALERGRKPRTSSTLVQYGTMPIYNANRQMGWGL